MDYTEKDDDYKRVIKNLQGQEKEHAVALLVLKLNTFP
jgi:hypothetical protein